VGYRNPPTAYRFKKGVSGNPKGRPRRQFDAAKILASILNDPVKYKDHTGTVTTKRSIAVMRKLGYEAALGNPRSARAFLVLFETIQRSSGEPIVIVIENALPDD